MSIERIAEYIRTSQPPRGVMYAGRSFALRCLRAIKAERTKRMKLDKRLRDLLIEISCRIEHGAESGGHLEYVYRHLKPIISRLS